MYTFPLYGILVHVNTFLKDSRLKFLEKMMPDDFSRFGSKLQLNIYLNDYEYSFGLYKEEDRYIYKLPGCCYIIGIGYIDVFCIDVDVSTHNTNKTFFFLALLIKSLSSKKFSSITHSTIPSIP